jgi:glycosyltransferase involved in cell wall biosynthesis
MIAATLSSRTAFGIRNPTMVNLAPIAVIIPVYNRRLKLLKTLECVVGQTQLPALLIVVDDGSTDGTAEAAKSWLAHNASFKWRVIEQPNAGVAAARNAGFGEVGALPFVCFLDSDDLWPANFIAEGFRAFEGRNDIVAVVADRVKESAGKEKAVLDLRAVAANPLLWLVCNTGGILSCTIIRSRAALSAGLFEPGIVSEDADFLLRLFLLGGAAHSGAAPVRAIKKAPLEPTEPPNLSEPSPELRYLWACHLTTAIARLPEPLLREHERLIRTAAARRWVVASFSNKRAGNQRRAFLCLLNAIWWDFDVMRRLAVIWSFLTGRKSRLVEFSTPLPSNA